MKNITDIKNKQDEILNFMRDVYALNSAAGANLIAVQAADARSCTELKASWSNGGWTDVIKAQKPRITFIHLAGARIKWYSLRLTALFWITGLCRGASPAFRTYFKYFPKILLFFYPKTTKLLARYTKILTKVSASDAPALLKLKQELKNDPNYYVRRF
jgi:hypothetical protein